MGGVRFYVDEYSFQRKGSLFRLKMVEAETIDEKYAELQKQLSTLDVLRLREYGKAIGIVEDALIGTLRTVGKAVRQQVDVLLEQCDDNDELKVIEELQAHITSHPALVITAQTGEEGLELAALRSRLGEVENQLNKVEVSSQVGSINEKSDRVVLRSECKIRGNIGKLGQAQSLTYISLLRQIESLKTDYSEDKIVDAIIYSVSPGLPLRSFLDAKQGLTLPVVLQILKSHFMESDATEYYNRLANAVQSVEESPVSFLLRLMELKEKIIFVSRTSDIKYTEEQTQRLLLKVIENGLTDECIRNKMRSSLTIETSDETLLERLTCIVTDESERDLKMRKIPKAKVRTVDAAESEMTKLREIVEKLSTQVNALTAERESERTAYRNMAPAGSTERVNTRTTMNGSRGCRLCRQAGEYCNHCYKCGVRGHFARNCLNGQ